MKRTLAVLSLAGVAFAAACSDTTTAPTPVAPPSGGVSFLVQSGPYGGNATCRTLLDNPTAFEIKIDPPRSGTYGPVTVTFKNDNKLVDFTSIVGVVGVFVKGGTGGGGYFYYYGEPGSLGDSNMGVAGYNNGQQAISHVSLCWNEPPTVIDGRLVISKEAGGLFDLDVDWDLSKSADPTSVNGFVGGNTDETTWTVTATRNETPINHRVSGTITVTNPTVGTVQYELVDRLTDLDGNVVASAIVTCPQGGTPGTNTGSLGPNASVTCSYTATGAGVASAAYNTANVTVTSFTLPAGYTGSIVGANTDPVPFAFEFSDTYSGMTEITVDDDRFTPDPEWTTSSTQTWTYDEAFPCGAELTYTEGVSTRTERNNARVRQDTEISDYADVQVTCYAPVPSKTAIASWGQTYSWTIIKTVNPDVHNLPFGGSADSDYSVTVTQNVVSSAGIVTGTISVLNPHPTASMTVSVTDVIPGATVDLGCGGALVIGAGQTGTCGYSATLGSVEEGTRGTNTATVTLNSVEFAATEDFTFGAPIVDGYPTINVSDNFNEGGYEALGSASGTYTFNYSRTFTCSSNSADYAGGAIRYTRPNIARIDETGQTSNASVTVNCAPPPPQAQGETATGAGFPWSATQGAPSTWFMYTPWRETNISPWGRIGVSTSAPLIAGQHHRAGTITGTRGSGSNSTSITITLNSDWRFANALEQVKIQPMSSCGSNQPYVSPGAFSVKRNASGSSITVPNLPNTACYGIHVDVERSQ